MTFQQYLNTRHDIIDRCERGILTESERDRLLDKVDNSNDEYFEAASEIGKLRVMIEKAYNDHNNGVISLGQREKVIGVLKDRISMITESVDTSFDDRYQTYVSSKTVSDEVIAKESVDYLYENRYIMESEACDLLDIIDAELVSESLDEDIDDMMSSMFAEGTNLESRRLYKETMKEVSVKLKQVKKCMKEKKYPEAKKGLTEIRASYEQLIIDIKTCTDETSIGSLILGGIWVSLCMTMRTMLLMFIPVVGIFAGWVLNVRDNIKQLIEIINNIKSSRDMTMDDLNLYKNKLIIIIKSQINIIKKIEKELDKAEKQSNTIDEINKDVGSIGGKSEE